MEDKTYKTTEARRRANKKYYEKNKEVEVLKNYYRHGRSFINRTDDIEKLNEYLELINERLKELDYK